MVDPLSAPGKHCFVQLSNSLIVPPCATDRGCRDVAITSPDPLKSRFELAQLPPYDCLDNLLISRIL
jgi:hypothetical protein